MTGFNNNKGTKESCSERSSDNFDGTFSQRSNRKQEKTRLPSLTLLQMLSGMNNFTSVFLIHMGALKRKSKVVCICYSKEQI